MRQQDTSNNSDTAAEACHVSRSSPSECDPLLQKGPPSCTAAVDPDSDNTMQDSPDIVRPSRKYIVEPAALLFCAALFSQATLVTQYVYYRVGQQYNATGNSTRAFVCDPSALANASENLVTSRIQSEASQWILYRNLACSIVALITLPLYASSSDYLGRKPGLLIPCAGSAIDALGLMAAALFDLPLVWLVAFGGAGALGGGFGAMFAAMFAYLADTTTRRERPVRVALIEASVGVAGTAMELLIGWWIKLMGYPAPLMFSALMMLATLAYVAFLVPEVRLRRQLPSKGGAFARALVAPFVNIGGLFAASARLSVRIGLLLLSIGVFSASFIGISTVSSLYQMNYPFCLDSVFIGYLNAAKILMFQVGFLIGLLVLRRCLGVKPLGLAIIGMASSILSSMATGTARTTPVLFASAAIAMFSMLPIPMLRAYASQIAPINRQGALFSCLGMLEVLGSLIGAAAFTVIYSSSQTWMPGFVYLTVSCTTLLALTVTCACAVINCCCPMPDVTMVAAAANSGSSGDEQSRMPPETRTVNCQT